MDAPPALSRRTFAARIAAGAGAASLATAAPPSSDAPDRTPPRTDGPVGGADRGPLEAPRPPRALSAGEQAEHLFAVLRGRHPDARLTGEAADAVKRQLARGVSLGRVLAAVPLTNADEPGPIWAAVPVARGDA